MSKAKFVILNSLVFVLLGSALVSVAIEVVWMLVGGQDSIPVRRLVDNFIIGLFISSAIVFLHLLVMRFNKKPLAGYLITVVYIALALAVVYLQTGLTQGIWDLDAKWLVIFLVVESFSLVLIVYWYRQINLYNHQLETKKAALRSSREV